MTVKSINVQTGEITIRERTSEEKAALPTTKQITDNELENIRIERNSLLMESDWTQSRDVTLSNDTDWKKYINKCNIVELSCCIFFVTSPYFNWRI